MRDKYYTFLSDNRISDTFIHIPEISYTKKLNILQSLFTIYTNEQINKALNEYELNYIRLNRIDIKLIFNTLKGIIQRNGK